MGASNCNVNHRASLGFSEAADFAPTQDFELTEQQLGGEPVQLKCACLVNLAQGTAALRFMNPMRSDHRPVQAQ